MFLNFNKLKTLNTQFLTNKTFKTEILYFYNLFYLNKSLKTKKELLFFINLFSKFFFSYNSQYLKNKQFYRRYFINFYKKQFIKTFFLLNTKKEKFNFFNKDYLIFFLNLNLLNQNETTNTLIVTKKKVFSKELKTKFNLYILNALRYLRLTRSESFDKIAKPYRFRRKYYARLRKFYFPKKKKKSKKKKFKFFKRKKKFKRSVVNFKKNKRKRLKRKIKEFKKNMPIKKFRYRLGIKIKNKRTLKRLKKKIRRVLIGKIQTKSLIKKLLKKLKPLQQPSYLRRRLRLKTRKNYTIFLRKHFFKIKNVHKQIRFKYPFKGYYKLFRRRKANLLSTPLFNYFMRNRRKFFHSKKKRFNKTFYYNKKFSKKFTKKIKILKNQIFLNQLKKKYFLKTLKTLKNNKKKLFLKNKNFNNILTDEIDNSFFSPEFFNNLNYLNYFNNVQTSLLQEKLFLEKKKIKFTKNNFYKKNSYILYFRKNLLSKKINKNIFFSTKNYQRDLKHLKTFLLISKKLKIKSRKYYSFIKYLFLKKKKINFYKNYSKILVSSKSLFNKKNILYFKKRLNFLNHLLKIKRIKTVKILKKKIKNINIFKSLKLKKNTKNLFLFYFLKQRYFKYKFFKNNLKNLSTSHFFQHKRTNFKTLFLKKLTKKALTKRKIFENLNFWRYFKNLKIKKTRYIKRKRKMRTKIFISAKYLFNRKKKVNSSFATRLRFKHRAKRWKRLKKRLRLKKKKYRYLKYHVRRKFFKRKKKKLFRLLKRKKLKSNFKALNILKKKYLRRVHPFKKTYIGLKLKLFKIKRSRKRFRRIKRQREYRRLRFQNRIEKFLKVKPIKSKKKKKKKLKKTFKIVLKKKKFFNNLFFRKLFQKKFKNLINNNTIFKIKNKKYLSNLQTLNPIELTQNPYIPAHFDNRSDLFLSFLRKNKAMNSKKLKKSKNFKLWIRRKPKVKIVHWKTFTFPFSKKKKKNYFKKMLRKRKLKLYISKNLQKTFNYVKIFKVKATRLKLWWTKFHAITRRVLRGYQYLFFRYKTNRLNETLKIIRRMTKKKNNHKLVYTNGVYGFKRKQLFKVRKAQRLNMILKLKYQLQKYFKFFYNYKTNKIFFNKLNLNKNKKRIFNKLFVDFYFLKLKKMNKQINKKIELKKINNLKNFNYWIFKYQLNLKVYNKKIKKNYNTLEYLLQKKYKNTQKIKNLILDNNTDILYKKIKISKFIRLKKKLNFYSIPSEIIYKNKLTNFNFPQNIFLKKNIKTKLVKKFKNKKKTFFKNYLISSNGLLKKQKLNAIKPFLQTTKQFENYHLQYFKFLTNKKNLITSFAVLESQLNILLYRLKFVPHLKLLPKIFFYNLVYLNNKIIRNPFEIVNLYELIQVPYILTKKFYFYFLNNNNVKLKYSKQNNLFYFLKILKNLYSPYLNKIWLPTYFTSNIFIASAFLHNYPTFEYFTTPLIKFTKLFHNPLHSKRLPSFNLLERNKIILREYQEKKLKRTKKFFKFFTTQYCLVRLDLFNFLNYYDNYNYQKKFL
jgi:hypothetical protein